MQICSFSLLSVSTARHLAFFRLLEVRRTDVNNANDDTRCEYSHNIRQKSENANQNYAFAGVLEICVAR